MEQNNLLMVYMKSEQHCYWEQMFQGTEKNGRFKESYLNGKLKTNFFFQCLRMYFKPQSKQTLNVIQTPFSSPSTISTQALFDGRIQIGEVKSEAFLSTLVYVLCNFAFKHIFTDRITHTIISIAQLLISYQKYSSSEPKWSVTSACGMFFETFHG